MSSSAADSDGEIQSRTQRSPLASQRAREEKQNPRKSRLEGLFPLSYKQGFSQWWTALPAAQAEHRVLSFIPYLQQPPTHAKTGSEPPTRNASTVSINQDAPSEQVATTNSITDPYGPRRWHSRLVPLSGRNRALNEFSVERTGEEVENNLVIIHGYGAGLGFFYKNFEPLSRAKGWQLYALDMLGMGRSSRPPFKLRSKTREAQITEAEDWFIDSLEEWRVKRKIDKFTLIGHSMGGYMAVCYALKYPGRLNKLILASPVGIPEDPYATHAAMPPPPEQDGDSDSSPTTGDNNNFLNARKKAEQEAQLKQKANPNRLPANDDATDSDASTSAPPRRPLPKWLTYLWDANISPFSFVRWAGPLGPRLVSGWTSRRFSHLPAEEALALHDYSYSLFRLRGSGEYALAYILAPGAFARSPLIRRIGGVGRQPLESRTHEVNDAGVLEQHPGASSPASPGTDASTSPKQQYEPGLPVVLMYGENDWMDVKGGYAAKKKIDAETQRNLANASAEEKERDQGSAKVVIIKDAGHHLYLDNAQDFNDVILQEMEDVRRRSRKETGAATQ
ncbi:putative cardiolipin-specific deacylase, mitochondrial [Cladophialophora carrionii]|uniref:Putative cardiolipin-specific deacylase, mitochondrial n=1 Tax=Cladophialophora carrionii TaxID=86049 RepID=A0A1C1CI80_9EURO|nr:putative cardiolipin-specific deacylase, mitochondrial [Cladophialophora carrionii]